MIRRFRVGFKSIMPQVSRVSDVLRPRRHHPTRLEGFFDAAFAFAVPRATQLWTIWIAGMIYAMSSLIAILLSKRWKQRIEALPAT